MLMSSVPWIEAYRPKQFDGVVLDTINKQIFKNIIKTGHFPNLLFYGPPGTGKTTTIINLINEFQITHNMRNKELVIHLNASDERGIDVIRNQICQFVNSDNLFAKGLKIVILDEVDYMTKTAQQALKYLIQNHLTNARFCLICNYVSRIDEGLQNEFIKLRFNQLPKEKVFDFLKNISIKENLNLTDATLNEIIHLHNSDIRSMINFIQTNQDNINNILVINEDVWMDLYNKFTNVYKADKTNAINVNILNECVSDISLNYNIDKKNVINNFLLFLIRNNSNINSSVNNSIINNKFLSFVENLIHNEGCNNEYYSKYAINTLMKLL